MLAADKGYDTSNFLADLRQRCVTLHVAEKVKGSQDHPRDWQGLGSRSHLRSVQDHVRNGPPYDASLLAAA